MKALVLAGGSGTRLRPFSYSMPKQLIPVANKPVLQHCLEDVRDAGCTEVGVVVAGPGQEIRAWLGDGSWLGVAVTYIPQEAPLGLAHCLRIARDFLGDDDILMYLGDNVLAGGVAEAAAAFRRDRPAAQLLLAEVADPGQYGIAELRADGSLAGLVEKPAEPRSNLAVVGVYLFTPEIHEAVAAIEPSARGELEITDAVQWLLERGRPVLGSRYTGYWKDTGRIDDLLDCNRVLLERLRRRVDGHVDAASELLGDVVVEPGARITRSRVVGPAVIGRDTIVEDSDIGAHTSIGNGCHLQLAGVSHSIVLDGGSVVAVRGIHGSLIGRSARVRLALQHRLFIGDDTSVEVAA